MFEQTSKVTSNSNEIQFENINNAEDLNRLQTYLLRPGTELVDSKAQHWKHRNHKNTVFIQFHKNSHEDNQKYKIRHSLGG